LVSEPSVFGAGTASMCAASGSGARGEACRLPADRGRTSLPPRARRRLSRTPALRRIPSFEHDGFRSTRAARSVATSMRRSRARSAAGGPRRRAGSNQIQRHSRQLCLPDAGLGHLRRTRPGARAGRPPDEARIAAALPRAETCLQALQDLMGEEVFLAGPALKPRRSPCRPDLAYFRLAPEGASLWRDLRVSSAGGTDRRPPSLAATRSPLEEIERSASRPRRLRSFPLRGCP